MRDFSSCEYCYLCHYAVNIETVEKWANVSQLDSWQCLLRICIHGFTMRKLGKHQVPCSSTLERIHRAAQCAKWAGARFWTGTRYTLAGENPQWANWASTRFWAAAHLAISSPHCQCSHQAHCTVHFNFQTDYLTVCRSAAHWRESTEQSTLEREGQSNRAHSVIISSREILILTQTILIAP